MFPGNACCQTGPWLSGLVVVRTGADIIQTLDHPYIHVVFMYIVSVWNSLVQCSSCIATQVI